MKVIRFSKNWNNKLSCTYFHTIRKNTYTIGETVSIQLQGKELFRASVEFMSEVNLDTIALKYPEILTVDTGLPVNEALEVFRRFYEKKNPNWKTDTYYLILLKKLN